VPTPEDTRPPLDATRLGAALADTPVAVEISEADPSTNATAAARARQGAPEGLVVATEHQTAGRGRLGRTWETPARSSLTFSVLLRPRVDPHAWPWLPLLTGHAVAAALRAAGVPADLKWPNDVLVDDRKVAGILLERVETPAGPSAVVGVGLNVSQESADLPVPTATSLLLAAGPQGPVPDRTALLGELLARLWREYATWQTDPGSLAARYRALCSTVGRAVRVELPDAPPLEGTATGVDEAGRLLVSGPDGEVAVGAGDVVHVRPAG
jgi:BirA family biotin operon repressor/biotin-[acetyl-CoA-carboxylase] ligase